MDPQVILFGAGIVCGITSGIGADGYRAWRSAVRIGGGLSIAADCLCWCVLAAFVSALLFYLNGGEVRFYFFAALLCGYGCYRYAAGDRIVRLWLSLCRGVRAAVRAVCKPIAVIILSCGRLLRYLKRKSPPENKN